MSDIEELAQELVEDDVMATLVGRRVGVELIDERFTTKREEDVNPSIEKHLSYPESVDKGKSLVKAWAKCEAPDVNESQYVRRGMSENRRTFEHITGQELDDAIREARDEIEELELRKIASYLLEP